jgi:hypothetical protein
MIFLLSFLLLQKIYSIIIQKRINTSIMHKKQQLWTHSKLVFDNEGDLEYEQQRY